MHYAYVFDSTKCQNDIHRESRKSRPRGHKCMYIQVFTHYTDHYVFGSKNNNKQKVLFNPTFEQAYVILFFNSIKFKKKILRDQMIMCGHAPS